MAPMTDMERTEALLVLVAQELYFARKGRDTNPNHMTDAARAQRAVQEQDLNAQRRALGLTAMTSREERSKELEAEVQNALAELVEITCKYGEDSAEANAAEMKRALIEKEFFELCGHLKKSA